MIRLINRRCLDFFVYPNYITIKTICNSFTQPRRFLLPTAFCEWERNGRRSSRASWKEIHANRLAITNNGMMMAVEAS